MKFNLVVDEKVSVWRRSHVTINADSLEEAVNDCLENGTANTEILDSEYIYETEKRLDDTVEVMDEHYNTLGINEK